MRQISLFLVVFGMFGWVMAQPTAGAARLIVSSQRVEVLRVDTREWLTAQEALLSTGDRVRTGVVGRARIVFAEGTEIILQPNTTLQIEAYQLGDEMQRLDVTFLSGEARFHLVETPASEYVVRTPRGDIRTAGANIAAFTRPDGQFNFLVEVGEGNVEYQDQTVQFGANEGWRFETDGTVSDVVRAANFDEVDSRLDGCAATLVPLENRRLPVYISPSAESEGIGVQNPYDVTRVLAATEDRDWYRIWYRGGAGWVPDADLRRVLLEDCVALRILPAESTEDPDEYIDTNVPAFRFCTGVMPPPAGWVPHVVQPGQTLFLLAERTETTVAALALVNCVGDPRRLRVGTTLMLPAAP